MEASLKNTWTTYTPSGLRLFNLTKVFVKEMPNTNAKWFSVLPYSLTSLVLHYRAASVQLRHGIFTTSACWITFWWNLIKNKCTFILKKNTHSAFIKFANMFRVDDDMDGEAKRCFDVTTTLALLQSCKFSAAGVQYREEESENFHDAAYTGSLDNFLKACKRLERLFAGNAPVRMALRTTAEAMYETLGMDCAMCMSLMQSGTCVARLIRLSPHRATGLHVELNVDNLHSLMQVERRKVAAEWWENLFHANIDGILICFIFVIAMCSKAIVHYLS
jgi:hypothetical protein